MASRNIHDGAFYSHSQILYLNAAKLMDSMFIGTYSVH